MWTDPGPWPLHHHILLWSRQKASGGRNLEDKEGIWTEVGGRRGPEAGREGEATREHSDFPNTCVIHATGHGHKDPTYSWGRQKNQDPKDGVGLCRATLCVHGRASARTQAPTQDTGSPDIRISGKDWLEVVHVRGDT